MLSTSRFATLLMLTTLVAVCSPLAAGQGRWTQTGPVTAFVYNMIADPADPEVLWVSAGGGGVFRSGDGGVTWSRVGRRPRVGDFTALLGCGDALLAASFGGGVWSWEPAPPRRPSGRPVPGSGAAATRRPQRNAGP